MNTEVNLIISADLPIPATRFPHDKGYSKALRNLKVGENVLIPTSRYSACHLAGKALGVGKYAMRTESSGIRIWRKE